MPSPRTSASPGPWGSRGSATSGPHATMQVKLCSLLQMVDASGPDMDRAETVTMFNDLCVLAPAALIDAPVHWTAVDTHRVRGEFTSGAHTVAAELIFATDGSLVDFVSDDRLRAASDGRRFVRQRWSTLVDAHRGLPDGRRAPCHDGRRSAMACSRPGGKFRLPRVPGRRNRLQRPCRHAARRPARHPADGGPVGRVIRLRSPSQGNPTPAAAPNALTFVLRRRGCHGLSILTDLSVLTDSQFSSTRRPWTYTRAIAGSRMAISNAKRV